MAKAFETGDEVFRSEWHVDAHDGVVHRNLTQPTEDLILKRNAELRKNPGALRDLSFGRLAASIPMNLFEKAIRDGYQLNSPDKETRQRDMRRFLLTPEGQTCLVREGVIRR